MQSNLRDRFVLTFDPYMEISISFTDSRKFLDFPKGPPKVHTYHLLLKVKNFCKPFDRETTHTDRH